MALSLQSWRPLAEGLQLGHSRRVDHDCGGGRTLLISRDTDGYRAYCFRCNEPGRDDPPVQSLAEKLAELSRRAAGDEALPRDATLPLPAVRDPAEWPVRARLWLAKAGLGATEIADLGAYYHPPSDRVVLPVLDGAGAPVFWQARALDGRQPKYLAPTCDKAAVLPRWGSAPSPTLCEDILSAYKIGLVGEGWALMGTKPSHRVIRELLERGGQVNVWMDNDLPPVHRVNRGQMAARKIIRELTAYGIKCRNIVSDKDPKLLFREQIKEILS